MTSLEIFKTQVELELLALKDGFSTFNECMEEINELFNGYKFLHKREITDAYIDGNYKSNRDIYWKNEDANKYYNEKFKKY